MYETKLIFYLYQRLSTVSRLLLEIRVRMENKKRKIDGKERERERVE